MHGDRVEQVEMDMEQQTDCKLGKEYIKAVYCHPDYLTYMQSMSPGEEKGPEAALKQDLKGKHRTTSNWKK